MNGVYIYRAAKYLRMMLDRIQMFFIQILSLLSEGYHNDLVVDDVAYDGKEDATKSHPICWTVVLEPNDRAIG